MITLNTSVLTGDRYINYKELFGVRICNRFFTFFIFHFSVSNLCLYGDCVQHYSVHHVLIWNNTVPYYPPFDFALVEYPTHCTWENIGQ